MKATPPSQAVPGRTYRVAFDDKTFVGRFVAHHPGCCVQLAVKGDPFLSLPLGRVSRMERA